MPDPKNDFSKQLKQIGVLTTVPILLFVGPAVGYWVGSWIDGRFGVAPWGSIILSLLGLVACGREVARLLKEVLDSEKSKEPRGKS